MGKIEAERRQDGATRAAFSDDEADLRLMDRIARGDRDAFRELYGTYYQPVLRFIQRITRRFDLSQEGVNDVMLVIWRNSHSFRHRSKVSTWIMGIAYRRALKLLAGAHRWSTRFMAGNFEVVSERPEGGVDASDSADLRDLLDEALKQLSPEHRAVIELTYFHGCSYQEIASIADCPVNTVKTRMFHARAKLRRLLPTLSNDEPCV